MAKLPIVYKTLSSRTIFVERRLSGPGRFSVGKGDSVRPFDVLGTAKVSGDPAEVDVAARLRVPASSLSEFLLVGSGGTVDRGQIIAERKSLFGLRRRRVRAPLSSQVTAVDSERGVVCLSLPKVIEKTAAGVSGEVVDLLDDQFVLIKTWAASVHGVSSWGGDCAGVLRVAAGGSVEIGTSAILASDKEKILVGGGFVTAEAIRKAQVVGVAGLVCGGVGSGSLSLVNGGSLSLMITEGFGRTSIPEKTFELLKAGEGGYGLIMSGMRELLVPVSGGGNGSAPSGFGGDSVDFFREIAVGDKVQLFSTPFFSRVGEVVEIMAEAARVRIGKETVSVPLRNLGFAVWDS